MSLGLQKLNRIQLFWCQTYLQFSFTSCSFQLQKFLLTGCCCYCGHSLLDFSFDLLIAGLEDGDLLRDLELVQQLVELVQQVVLLLGHAANPAAILTLTPVQ